MAGRSQQRLEQVRQELTKLSPDMADVPILTADAFNAKELGDLLRQTKVVLTTAGPYAQMGNLLVEQAVEQGTHYCDLTGEITWVRRNIDKYHKAAEEKGTKIVHCCGYDSVPSDIGALMMVDHCQKKLGKKVAKVYTLAGDSKGGVSGGTIASGMNMMATDAQESKKVAFDAYYLASAHRTPGNDRPAPYLPKKLPETQEWVGPFVMEGCNGRVVHLSNALCNYNPNFRYMEVMEGGQGYGGFIKSSLISAILVTIGACAQTSLGRALITRLAPKQGAGPSLETQRTGYWNHKILALTEEEGGTPGQLVVGEAADKSRDPGYWSTSRMILESALAMALDEDKIAKTGSCRKGGVLSPASAMGLVLLDRLRAAGFIFRVVG